MDHNYMSAWSSGWGWIIWMGLILFMVSSFGSWGYSYRIHRRLNGSSSALGVLSERYAKGEITIQEFRSMKAEILSTNLSSETKPV